ncbi:CENPB DNA-binding domain-containing protein 1 [Portunus trituberculatus]|uniref:CENPB DNA-binding domain-containing protein 1 n=1 Tax=Portunus trituberculatus TaxID=210409 RepID=A0A5B7J4T3_PORTR|nr:CENPB DNA-binding domain-containing protein 1 [Portunus trituberculatus]
MTQKRPATNPSMLPSITKKTRKSLTREVKVDIIHRYERGKKTNSIDRHHGLTPSTVSTIFKSADSIKKASLQAKRTTQTCYSAMDKMESLVEIARHTRMVHWDKSRPRCSECNQYFDSKEELNTHRQKHKMKCAVCDKTFLAIPAQI